MAEQQPPEFGPDKIAKLERLEGIFLPQQRILRAAKLRADNPPEKPMAECKTRYVHYTTAESAIRVIQSKRLWMRNTTCMADFREVEHGYDLLSAYFGDNERYKNFCAACDVFAPGVAAEASKQFVSWWNQIRFSTYLASVSEHLPSEDTLGRLSMWRAFGNGQPRVALVISVQWISGVAEALGISFSPVMYMDRKDVHSWLDSVAKNVAREKYFLSQLPPQEFQIWLFGMLLSGVACTKHKGFSEEREWRAVYSPNLGKSDLLESAIETIHGVPQQVYKIPLDEGKSPLLSGLELSRIIDRIIIGPSQYPVAIADAFIRALEVAGVPDAASKVFASDIPLRD